MKKLHILLFSISLLCTTLVVAQQESDTLKVKKTYGLRVGIDISKPIISFLDEDKKGIEIVGDFRISTNYYVAAELGFEDVIKTEDNFNFSTKGSFIKLGFNYNAYENWKGMNNQIFVGARYGFSFFEHTLIDYTPNVKGSYFSPDTVASNTNFTDLNAHWLEFLFGMKVETLKNLFLGAQISVKKMITYKEPVNFKNLYIPGFNRVFTNDMGIGFNYSLSYLIPIVKKNK